MGNESDFSRWRGLFWPIYRSELPKFLPLLSIFFLITFIYNILRSYKDTLVITQAPCGAEVLAFIKIWAVLPAAILMTYLFARLSHVFSKEKVFYIMISFFIGFFLLFAIVLYPAREYLHPHGFADMLQTFLPKGCAGLIALLRNWTFTLFYVMSELWSSMIFSVLFWSFANEVTSVKEAKRFYGLLITGGNIAGIFAGEAAFAFSQKNIYLSWLPIGQSAWDQSIFLLTLAIFFSGLLIIFLFRLLTTHVNYTSPRIPCEEKTLKLTFQQQIATIFRSRYLLCIALIVLGYNIAINLVEIVWKHQINLAFPDPNDYNAYMGKVMIAMGVIATITGLFATNSLIRRSSWTLCALIPTVIVGVTGAIFFSYLLYNHGNASLPLMLAVTLGSFQNCLSRASKYTFFDATKEIAFIPLDTQAKLNGKAAIDGVGSRLGKSGGSIIHQSLLIFFSSIGATTPYIAMIFIAIVACWGFAVVALGKQFEKQQRALN